MEHVADGGNETLNTAIAVVSLTVGNSKTRSDQWHVYEKTTVYRHHLVLLWWERELKLKVQVSFILIPNKNSYS